METRLEILLKSKFDLDQEAFDDLLLLLDTDRERAGGKYEQIRRKLFKFFLWRGCTVVIAEELTDEVMTRVARKVKEIASTYVGDPACYCYGVARLVYLEYIRTRTDPPLPVPPPEPPDQEKERYDQCMDLCLDSLGDDNRLLVLSYFGETKKFKIDNRRKLANERGLTPNTLRMRILRIKTILRTCIEECVRREDAKLIQ